jgi:para-nitrobenzyl esterase
MNNQIKWNCPSGEIIGWKDEGVLRATGIKYANANRFEKPKVISNYKEVILANKWSPFCPQNEDTLTIDQFKINLTRPVEMDENCQYLSVTIPDADNKNKKLPVMVWIHGGSYVSGGGDYEIYDPKQFVIDHNVIVVSITYRLGIFGYLGDGVNKPANLGLLDQIEALKWIKSNIIGFGGNPNNITLFGESAGGDSVAHLLISEGTEYLFNRAIIESAPFGIMKKRQKMTMDMLELTKGITKDTSVEEIITLQKEIPSKLSDHGLKGNMPFGVQYGYYPLPSEDELVDSWKKASDSFDIMVGYNYREISTFADIIPFMIKNKKIPLIGNLINEIVIDILTYLIYKKDAKRFFNIIKNGNKNTYLYEFTWKIPKNKLSGGHTSELIMLFENKEIWQNSKFLEGMTWEDFHKKAKILKNIWFEYANKGIINTGEFGEIIKIIN